MEGRLHKFAVVAEIGSITQAAAELHISQPALSTAIHKLERELHTALFIPGSRPLMLTPAGQLAYQTAKKITINTTNLQTRLLQLTHEDIPLRIGMIDSVAGGIFADTTTLDTLTKGVAPFVMVDNSRVLLAAIERDELDVAFIVGKPRATPASVRVQHLAPEPLVAVCAREQYKHAIKAAASRELHDFISYDQHSTTYQLIQEALQAQGIVVYPKVYSTSPEVTLRLVQLGQGTAFLPYTMVAPLVATGTLSLVDNSLISLITRDISFIHRRDKELFAPVSLLVGQVRRALETAMADAAAGTNSTRA